VADRVAQMVVKKIVEREVEPIFLPDSYGSRVTSSPPFCSAHGCSFHQSM
jgi:hypothetical protein